MFTYLDFGLFLGGCLLSGRGCDSHLRWGGLGSCWLSHNYILLLFLLEVNGGRLSTELGCYLLRHLTNRAEMRLGGGSWLDWL